MTTLKRLVPLGPVPLGRMALDQGRRGRWVLAMLPLLALLPGCSSPNPVLFTVASQDGRVQTGAPAVILLQRIGLARYLERTQIVASAENYKLDVRANDWWGEPLGAMLSRILVEELGQRLPGSTLLSEDGAVSSRPDATIELNLRRLDKDATGMLVLQAQAAIDFRGRDAPVLQNFRISVPPPSPGIPGEVAAISSAVGQLADGLAAMLTAGPAGR